MRELTEQEASQVVGGFRIPGGNFISGIGGPLNALGIYGAGMTAFSFGRAIGGAINHGYETVTGSSLGSDLGGWLYEKS